MKIVRRILRRMAAFLVLAAFLMQYFVTSASAASLSCDSIFSHYYSYTSSYSTFTSFSNEQAFTPSLPVTSLIELYVNKLSLINSYYVLGYPSKLDLPGTYDSSVGVYLSFYYIPATTSIYLIRDLTLLNTDAQIHYIDSNGCDNFEFVDVDTFTPSTNYSSTTGYRVSASASADEINPISDLYIEFYPSSSTYPFVFSQNNKTDLYTVCLTSCSVVSTPSSAELESLEDIANSIASQNDILNAMYGDVMMLLNAIWERQGTIIDTQRIANNYLLNIANYLSRIQIYVSNIYDYIATYLYFLEYIASTADDILYEIDRFHQDFIDELELLISTVSLESDNIQAKMEEIYNLLIAYLDSQFSSAVDPGAFDANNRFGSVVSDSETIESSWTNSLSAIWGELDLDTYIVPGTFASSMMWVSSWWSNFLDAMGDYRMIVFYPLLLGVILLLIGRISRSHFFRSGGDDDA